MHGPSMSWRMGKPGPRTAGSMTVLSYSWIPFVRDKENGPKKWPRQVQKWHRKTVLDFRAEGGHSNLTYQL